MAATPNLSDFELDPWEVIRQIRSCGITHVTTVPDYVMLSVYRALEQQPDSPRVIACSTEDDAVSIAAGLHIGGARPMVMMQNQGLYASLNSIRAIGLDAKLPLFFLIGQFGREYSNLGRPAAESTRPVVRNTERILEALDISYVVCDRADQVDDIGKACAQAFATERPTAALVGHYTGWGDR